MPRRAGAQPRFAVAAEGDFGLRHEAMLDGTPTTLRFGFEREGRWEAPLFDAGLGDPILLRWRELDLEQNLRRLPGGPGSLETLRGVLEGLPAAAPGREALAGIVGGMVEAGRLLEAAQDAGASGWQTLWHVVVPLTKPGLVIGSIFVITIVMGDFVTIGVMGGQQIASIGKIIQVQTSYLQFPLAAANAMILLAVVLMIIWGLTRLVDIRKEL